MRQLVARLLRRGEVGQSIVIMALGFIGLVTVVGITTDVSILFARYTQLRRAVDAAAIAAAGQMREDRDIATVNLTARQFIEFHGINPRDVIVDTCETLRIPVDNDGDGNIDDYDFIDEDICPPDDTRKLVRVTAQIESPTVFLRLVGWGSVTLEASAVSETAVLDVVLILDVSESMLAETTYADWAYVGQGVATYPPRLDEGTGWIDGRTTGRAQPDTVLYRMTEASADGFIPVVPPIGQDPFAITPGINPLTPARDVDYAIPDVATYPPTDRDYSVAIPPEKWWEDWFWQEHLLGVPQEQVNQRIYYLNGDDHTNANTDGDGFDAETDPLAPGNIYYQAETFVPSDVQDLVDDGRVTNGQILPREGCRVRFYPYSYSLNVPQYLQDIYTDEGMAWPTVIAQASQGDTKWRGFIPSYNFYGCCNDPGTGGTVDVNGNIDISAQTGNAPDGDFSDLVCQPFKQARDATRLFLDRIDFERGDRVAFVTFDRTAHIVDPDGAGPMSPMISRFENETTGASVNARTIARNLLDTSIGVRAEPNFYIWDEGDPANPGGIFRSPGLDIGGWTRVDTDTGQRVPAYAQGFDTDGSSLPIDFYETDIVDDWGQNTIDYNNYPVAGNCFYQNAATRYPFTRYANRNTTVRNGDAALTNFMTPDIYNDPYWANIRVNGYTDPGTGQDLIDANSLTHTANAYELFANCRGTNMGAALREANQVLTQDGRRVGAVWIMILLSDGAAGASDPARILGELPDTPQPYTNVNPPADQYDWRRGGETPANPSFNQYGGLPDHRGDYGIFGLCPPGGADAYDGNQFGELMLTDSPANEPSFPFCSDEDPRTRHFCLAEPPSWVGDQRCTEAAYGAGFCPNKLDFEGAADPGTATENNYYDIDLGNYNNESRCSNLYDVDDYARDWADFVGGIPAVNLDDEGASEGEVLPTIFTIGFGLEFDPNVTGSWYERCVHPANVESCLGEELLRYIADVGDNFRIDNDYQQDLRYEVFGAGLGTPDEDIPGGYGPQDPCQDSTVEYIPGDVSTAINEEHGESCGNYYNAPGQAELQDVFDDIAARMFTRIAG